MPFNAKYMGNNKNITLSIVDFKKSISKPDYLHSLLMTNTVI